jgi:HK97 family phage prohead protease
MVVGRWDHLEETSFGLWAEGTILDDHHASLVENHAIWGLSIGYLPQKINQPEGAAQRELLTIGLKEISITPVPVNRHCRIMWTDKWKAGPSKALLKAQVGGSTHADVVKKKAVE